MKHVSQMREWEKSFLSLDSLKINAFNVNNFSNEFFFSFSPWFQVKFLNILRKIIQQQGEWYTFNQQVELWDAAQSIYE